MRKCIFKTISCIILLIILMMSLTSVVLAEESSAYRDNEVNSGTGSEVVNDGYELIDGDIRNSETLKEANKSFSSSLKCFPSGEPIAIVLQQNSRVKIDYENNIFKNITTVKEVEDAWPGIPSTGTDITYKVEIDSTRTKISLGEILFYGNYIDENGEKKKSERPQLSLPIITEGTEVNSIIDREDRFENIQKTKYIRFEVGMNVGDFKQQYKSMINNSMEDSYIAYMDKEGKFKMSPYKMKIPNEISVKDRNNPNVQLIDSGKIYTGIYLTYGYEVDMTTIPKDIEGIEEYFSRVGEYSLVNLIDLVVPGDITGKGNIDVTDLSVMQEQIVESTQLEGAYKEAADMNNDKEVDVVDLSEIQEYIVNN